MQHDTGCLLYLDDDDDDDRRRFFFKRTYFEMVCRRIFLVYVGTVNNTAKYVRFVFIIYSSVIYTL